MSYFKLINLQYLVIHLFLNKKKVSTRTPKGEMKKKMWGDNKINGEHNDIV